MLIKSLQLGPIETNCYIVTDEKTLECAVIDPGDESNTVLNYLEMNNLKCRVIMLTHGHFDHVTAAPEVAKETGAPVYINKMDTSTETGNPRMFKPAEDTHYYGEGDEIKVGSLVFRVMETPGHTPGGVTLICEDALFTGDTLFRDSCGRTDFPGGSMDIQLVSLRRISELPGDYEVYPGHMDSTTLERERRFNYYVRSATE